MKRGKLSADLITLEESDKTVEDYVPDQITRTCTSLVDCIWDIQGLLTPLTLKLKHDLQGLLNFTSSWTNPIPDKQRYLWISSFQIIEDSRDILYVRCQISPKAIHPKVRLLFFAYAADPGIITAIDAFYNVPPVDHTCSINWTCTLLFGKGLLVPDEWTLPHKELHGLSLLADLKVVLYNILSDYIYHAAFFSDSAIALSWICYKQVYMSTFVRNRSVNIRTKLGLSSLYHPADYGTNPQLVTANDVRSGSIWLTHGK